MFAKKQTIEVCISIATTTPKHEHDLASPVCFLEQELFKAPEDFSASLEYYQYKSASND